MTLPALPFLCIALVWDTQHVSKVCMFKSELNIFSLILPTSITNTQSLMVIDVSEMLVERIIFLFSVISNTKFCSSTEKDECNGKIVHEHNLSLIFKQFLR